MKGEAGILQDRIEVAALERGVRDTQKRIGSRENEKLKGGSDPGLHRKRVCLQLYRQVVAESGDQRAEEGEDQNPQHHGAFVVPPDAGQTVHQRHRRIRILVDVEHREIGADIGGGERGERQRDEGELGQRRRRRDAHERRVPGAGADDRHHPLDQRQAERQHQRIMADFGDHFPAPATGLAARCA